MNNSLAELNEEQQKAVRITKGPILILAGAGSGKTRVITYRIAHLLKKGIVDPRGILAITFTNKAADEMRTRIYNLLDNAYHMWIRTFHSSCARILREVLVHKPSTQDIIGATSNFTIYDEQDQIGLMKECLKDLNIDPREFSPSAVAAYINRVKQDLRKVKDIDSDLMKELYKHYDRKLSEYNALDFGDLIMRVVRVLQNEEDILSYYQKRFKYILVDEYQDTNNAQYVLTKLLAQEHRNLCVVGDDDQSIYSWRGAEIRNILEFEKDFPDAVVIKLEQNYRSTRTILQAASAVVLNNEHRKTKVLWSDNEQGEKIEFSALDDAYAEAAFVARKIIEAKFQGMELGQIAIFYRINFQSRVFEEAFIRFQIPYEVVGALKFYERAEIKDVLGYLRVIDNPRDAVSLRRIINVPTRKIGHITLERLVAYAKRVKISLYDALKDTEKIEDLTRKTKKRVREFSNLMEQLRRDSANMDLYDFVLEVVKNSAYMENFDPEKSEKDYIRRKNVEELLISIKDYAKQSPDATLSRYLADVTLHSQIDEWDASSQRVSLMTLHNAKGLEFDTVFITGLEDGLIPHYKSKSELDQYEEERRLLYVGITRARQKLFLTYARQRPTFRGGLMYTMISPFFREIPDDVFATTLGSGLDLET
ncbi:MAG: UvrD-helicase domain-containing protein [bacterium]